MSRKELNVPLKASNDSNQFPTFMFHDMFKMRDFCTINCSRNYFYIGYFPKNVDLKQGPYFIGAFELRPHSREFLTHAIIQNPYYYNIDYDKTKFVDFKKNSEHILILQNGATD